MDGRDREAIRGWEREKSVGGVRHTVEFSGRTFQAVDTLLMVQASYSVPLRGHRETERERK